MNVLVIHRSYRIRGGEDVFLDDILLPTLRGAGVPTEVLKLPPLKFSDIFEIIGMVLGFEKIRPSHSAILKKVRSKRYTHVLFNNFIPTLSLALPRELKAAGIKTLAWLHNFRVDCANGLRFNGNNFCVECSVNGSTKSFLFDCQRNRFQSFLYALTYRKQRVARHVIPFIDHFICNSNYTKAGLEQVGAILKLKLSSTVFRMPVQAPQVTATSQQSNDFKLEFPKPFYLFVGRLSYEKGADLFADMANKYTKSTFIMCGEGPLSSQIESRGLKNLKLAGFVEGVKKNWLYENCEAVIIPSRVPETSSLVISESQPFATPIVYPMGGGAEETFHFLKRTGCKLQDFQGQSFERNGRSQATPFASEDSMNLKRLFEESS